MAKAKPAGKSFSSAVSKFAGEWKTARKAKPGSFEDAKVEEGDYFARVASAKAGVDKGGNAYVSINFKIVRGPHTGGNLSKFSGIKSDKDLEYLGKDFQRLGYEVEDLEIGEIEDLVADLNKLKPYCKLQVKHDTYTATKGPNKGQDVESQRVYIQKPIEQKDLPPGDDGDDAAKPAKGGKPKTPPKKKVAAKK